MSLVSSGTPAWCPSSERRHLSTAHILSKGIHANLSVNSRNVDRGSISKNFLLSENENDNMSVDDHRIIGATASRKEKKMREKKK